MDKNNILSYVGSGVSIFAGVYGLEYGLNLTILIIGILSGLLAILRTIYFWYKEAKADGKITKNEIVDLGEKVKEPIKDIVENIEEIKSERNNKEDTK